MIEVLKDCFAINLNEYNNIGINLEINKIVLCLFFAMIICIVFYDMYRRNIKLAVSQLTRHGAKSEENAKTLKEIGLVNSKSVKRLLSGDNLLTKITGRVGEKKYEYNEYKSLSKKEKNNREKVDFSTARFYIKEDMTSVSERINSGYSITVAHTVISCVFTAIICVCIIACMPGILNVINNLL